MSRPKEVQTARERIARNLKEWRSKRKLSQQTLSERVGLSRVYLSKIENCAETVSVDNLEKIATALGIDISQLLQA